jgi:hypothetical protein
MALFPATSKDFHVTARADTMKTSLSSDILIQGKRTCLEEHHALKHLNF